MGEALFGTDMNGKTIHEETWQSIGGTRRVRV